MKPPAPVPPPETAPPELDMLEMLQENSLPAAGPAAHGNAARSVQVLVAFVCVALVVLDICLVMLARSHEVEQLTMANENLASAIAQHVDSTVLDAEHMLDDTVFEMEQANVEPQLVERLQPALVSRVARVEQLAGLFVYDAQGRWVVTSEAWSNGNLNNSDREYFIFHRDNPSREAHLGLPIRSRSSGEWVVPLSRRLQDADGRFAGVALATLQLGYFKRILARPKLGEQGAIALALDGHLLVRLPFQEADIGRDVRRQPVLQLAARMAAGSNEERSVIDQVVRIISFGRALNYPLVAVVAVGQDEVLGDWRRSSIVLTMAVLGLCALVVLGGTFLVGTLRRRGAAELHLRLARDALAGANEKLARMARDDGLTGIPNRRFFDMRLLKLFGNAQRTRRPLAVVMVDVDEFKKFNDRYGHVAGDECLRQVAQAVRSAVRRPEDLLARYGGEEMVLLLPDTDVPGALHVAETARRAVEALGIPHADSRYGVVTVSLGVAAATPAPEALPTSLVNQADHALYRAKEAGRNRSASV